MSVVNRLGLPLIADRITEGKGNCFPIAVLDQCRRPEILSKLPGSTKKIVQKNRNVAQMQLRIAIKKFIQSSDHPNAILFKANYQNEVSTASNESWDQYWHRMAQDKVWADYIFIQATVWYLKHDIMIITTSNTDENPLITISGNIDDERTPCQNATLTIGSKSNTHFQSLLPIEAFQLSESSKLSQRQEKFPCENISQNNQQPAVPVSHHDYKLQPDGNYEKETKLFKYRTERTEVIFLITSDGLMQCYCCQKPFKMIVQHIKQSSECRNDINIEIKACSVQSDNRTAKKR